MPLLKVQETLFHCVSSPARSTRASQRFSEQQNVKNNEPFQSTRPFSRSLCRTFMPLSHHCIRSSPAISESIRHNRTHRQPRIVQKLHIKNAHFNDPRLSMRVVPPSTAQGRAYTAIITFKPARLELNAAMKNRLKNSVPTQ